MRYRLGQIQLLKLAPLELPKPSLSDKKVELKVVQPPPAPVALPAPVPTSTPSASPAPSPAKE